MEKRDNTSPKTIVSSLTEEAAHGESVVEMFAEAPTASVAVPPIRPPAPTSDRTPPRHKLTADEAAVVRRLHADSGLPPSDRPDATLVCDRPDSKCWRRKALTKGGFDEFESELWLPVEPETMLAMMCDVGERHTWDPTTLSVKVLSTTPPAPLRRLHDQDGDDMMLVWQFAMPRLFSNREYVLRRRVCVVSEGDDADGSGRLYSKVDTADDGPAARALVPHVARGSRRVTSHVNIQAISADPTPRGGTRFRALIREDPMMILPKWLLGLFLEKTMPSSLASMVKSSIAYEERRAEKRRAAAELAASDMK